MADRIQIRRDTAANWAAANPTLAQGEEGWETDTGLMKMGDGSTAWTSLHYTFENADLPQRGEISPLQPRGLTVAKLGIILPVGTAAFESWLVESPNVVFDPATQQLVMVYTGYSTLAAPTANTPTTATTGGTIPASQTRYYKITSLNSGESTPSAEVSVTAGSGTSTNANTVTWSAVAAATGGYRVYVSTTPGGENSYFTVPAGTTTFTDTGASGAAGAPTSTGSPGNASVGLATSLDGVNWTRTGAPVIQGTGNAGDPDQWGTTGPSLWIENGTYYLFYIGLDASGYESGTKRMMLATATSINGPWTRQGVIIAPAGTGWRQTAIYHRSIVKRPSGTYVMLFNAYGTVGGVVGERIGYATATSPSGPWTVDDTNSPVVGLGASGAWDSQIAGDPSLYRVGDTWYMAYYGYNGTNGQDGVAFTTEANFPLGWTKHPQNPILKVGPTQTFDDTHAHKPFIMVTPGAIYHYYTAVGTNQPTQAQRAIALAIDAPVQVAQPVLKPSPVVDNFTRMDSATNLNSAPTGQAWTNSVGVWGNVGYIAEPNSLVGGQAIASIPAGTADGRTSFRIATPPSTGASVGLIFRMADQNNFIWVDVSSTAVNVTKRVAGNDTSLSTASRTVVAGDVITIYAYGVSLTVQHNGVTVGSIDEIFASQNGKLRGLRSYAGGGAQIDDFTATPF